VFIESDGNNQHVTLHVKTIFHLISGNYKSETTCVELSESFL